MNAILQDIQYSDDYPWPAAADGAGHSLVMTRPDYGEDSVEAWEASDYVNGNPGTYNRTFTDDLANVVINEVLVHTDLPDIDFVELYNHSNLSANIGNLLISDRRPDDPATVQDESVGIGDGATAEFTGTLLRDSLRSDTIQFTDGTQIVTDDGSGNLVGDVNPGGTNSIDYATGAFSVTFAAAPAVDAAITADYEYITEYRIPYGTTIAPRGFMSFDQNTLGFSLNMQGDEVYLWNSDGDRIIDAIKFGAQENGVSLGRYADGADEFRVLSSPTPGMANAAPVNYDIVINEIMYNPVTDHQNEVVGVGDGATADFAGTLGRDLLRKGSIQFTDGSQVVTDDGNGNLVGDVNPGGDNEIDYDTGAFSLTLAAAPVLYVRVTVDYDVNAAFEETDYEFVELYNRGGSDVDLGSWKFTEGIRYTFPAFQQEEQDVVGLGDGATTEFADSLP
nr:hypothetical protein [Planctomycetota bacterium]